MTKTDLRRQVYELPDNVIEVASDLLPRAGDDPDRARLLAAPCDDEPVSEEEEGTAAGAIRRIDAGEGIPWDQARKLLEAGDE